MVIRMVVLRRLTDSGTGVKIGELRVSAGAAPVKTKYSLPVPMLNDITGKRA